VIPWWWDQEPDDRQVEPAGEREQLLGVELATLRSAVGALNSGDRSLAQPGAKERGESVSSLVLGQPSQLAGAPEVVGDNFVEVHAGHDGS